MLIAGLRLLCPDGVVRPVIYGEVLAADGSWVKAPFLVDTAADRTVQSANVLAALGLQPLGNAPQLSGVGGEAMSVLLQTEVRLTHEGGGKALFRGRYAAVTLPESLDMSVLGRDITNLFAVVVDRPGDFVALVGQRHHYTVAAM